jgi:two-component system cell cycle sensor histidine kinase/response regulator CckA
MENHPCPHGGYLKCTNVFCEYGIALSEVLHCCCDVLEKIAQGDTSQKIDIKVERNTVQRLIDSINKVSQEVSAMIDLTHELAIGICEHFDVLRRLHEGDFSATASEDSSVEVIRMLGQLINKLRDRFVEYINKIKEQHQDLIYSYEQQKTILSSIGVAVIVVEEDMTIEYANEEFESLTGYTKKEVEGKMKWTEFFAEEMLNKMIEYNKLSRISPSLAPRQYESKLKDRNGKIKEVLLNVGMIPYTKQSIASIIDISERKKIQEQLIHSQKMESLGFLSGRVAHEFNNILTAVLGFSGILYAKIEDSQLKNYVQKIIEASERAKDLSKKLLLFSRKEESKEDIQEISLNKFFNEFSEFLKSIIGKDITLKINLPEEEIIYKIDRTHLEVILMNLVTNSRDAMSKGGELSVCLKRVSIDAEYSYTHPLVMPGEYLLIIVSDTGIGMDEQTKQKIFEPFFTTKPKGKGTGLGLSTVFGLVKKYEGHIHVYSELGKGTTFKIYLPIKEKKIKEFDRDALKGVETILVVDDDDQTRGFICSFLKEYPYNVYEAKNGQEALEIFERNKEHIALSLVDLVMPGIPGIEVMKQIKKIKPEAKVIIMSGYPLQLKDVITVEKTISSEEILFKIRNMINGKE